MDNTWVISVILLFLSCELGSSQGASQGWILVPGTVWACAGENVSLPWKYNETIGVPKVVNVARSELTITLVSKIGSDDARSHRPRATFLPNAGVDISNVTADDSGKYESTVVFSDQHSLVDEATLIVYETCPDRQEFDNPEVYVILSIPMEQTNVNMKTPVEDFPVHFKARVPKSDPKVNCTLYVGDIPYDCESGEANVESAENINVNITVKLSYPALVESSRSIIYTNEVDDIITTSSVSTVISQEDTTIVPSINEALKAGGGSDLMPAVVVFGLLAFVIWPAVLLLLLYIRHRSKKRQRWTVPAKQTVTGPGTPLVEIEDPPIHVTTPQEAKDDDADDPHLSGVIKDKTTEAQQSKIIPDHPGEKAKSYTSDHGNKTQKDKENWLASQPVS